MFQRNATCCSKPSLTSKFSLSYFASQREKRLASDVWLVSSSLSKMQREYYRAAWCKVDRRSFRRLLKASRVYFDFDSPGQRTTKFFCPLLSTLVRLLRCLRLASPFFGSFRLCFILCFCATFLRLGEQTLGALATENAFQLPMACWPCWLDCLSLPPAWTPYKYVAWWLCRLLFDRRSILSAHSAMTSLLYASSHRISFIFGLRRRTPALLLCLLSFLSFAGVWLEKYLGSVCRVYPRVMAWIVPHTRWKKEYVDWLSVCSDLVSDRQAGIRALFDFSLLYVLHGTFSFDYFLWGKG